MTGGRMWYSVSILFCLMATVHPHPTKWWLLATVNRSELRDNNGNLLPFQCENYTNIMTPSQQDLCFEDRNVMSAVVLGVQRAIYTCQEIFEGCIWNCKTFTEDVLLGRGVEDTANREREFVRMLLAASITYDLTQECIRHNLGSNCFDWSVPFVRRVNNTLVFGKGGANIEWASSITRRVMEECSDVLTHNIEAGIQLANNTYVHCIELFGLNVKNCHLDIGPKHFYPYLSSYNTSYQDELVKALRNRYHGAVKVNCSLAPVNGDPPTSTDVVFTANSPNHCVANANLDIPGTSGRTCDPLATDCNNCTILCCGRGYRTLPYYKIVKVYVFIIVKGKITTTFIFKHVLVICHMCN